MVRGYQFARPVRLVYVTVLKFLVDPGWKDVHVLLPTSKQRHPR